MTVRIVAQWRNALRDSDLDSTAKLVGFVLSTYLTADGRTGHDAAHPSPAKTTLAAGATLSARYKGSRAVDAAIDRLEASGLVKVDRRRGTRGFGYTALIPHDYAGFNPQDGAGFDDEESRATVRNHPARNGAESRTVAREKASESERTTSTRAQRAGKNGSRSRATEDPDLLAYDR